MYGNVIQCILDFIKKLIPASGSTAEITTGEPVDKPEPPRPLPRWKRDHTMACRDLNLLTPEMQAMVEKFVKKAKSLGFIIKILETYRTKERQNYLRNAGKSWIKVSKHQKRIAIDAIPLTNGKIDWNFPIDKWKILGDLWKSYSSKNRWGGDWKVRDYVHFESADK